MTKLLGGKIVLACICDFFKIKNNLLGGGGDSSNHQEKNLILLRAGEIIRLNNVNLPGKFHGQGSLAGYSPWYHKELPMTESLVTHTYMEYNSQEHFKLYFEIFYGSFCKNISVII